MMLSNGGLSLHPSPPGTICLIYMQCSGKINQTRLYVGVPPPWSCPSPTPTMSWQSWIRHCNILPPLNRSVICAEILQQRLFFHSHNNGNNNEHMANLHEMINMFKRIRDLHITTRQPIFNKTTPTQLITNKADTVSSLAAFAPQ